MATIPSAKYSVLDVDSLPLLDIMSAFAYAIKESDEINSWCSYHYGTGVAVFSGSDPDNPPASDSYPLVELFPMEDNAGRDIEQIERKIGLVCGIHDDSVETVAHNGLTMQTGVLRLEEFYRLVISAAAGADLSGGYVADVVAARSEESLFPYFLVGAEIRIVKPL